MNEVEKKLDCESCPYNNNAQWNERNCPMKYVGMCYSWREDDEE